MRYVDLATSDVAIGSSSPPPASIISSDDILNVRLIMSYENTSKAEGESLSLGSQVLDTAAKKLQVHIPHISS